MSLPTEELPLVPKPPEDEPAPACILLGRFQPFHLGHIALIEQAFASQSCDSPRILIGSSNRIESEDNPWTWEERQQMIEVWLAATHPDRNVDLVAVPDIEDPSNWVAHAARYHGRPGMLFTSDARTAALYSEAGWPVEICALERRDSLQGWRVRTTLKMLSVVSEREAVISVMSESLHESVIEWMLQEDRLSRLAVIGPPVEPVG